MNCKTIFIILVLVSVLAIFTLITWVGGTINPSLQLGETTLIRFVFVVIGLVIVFIVYWFTRSDDIWSGGRREIIFMTIGAVLYAVFSYLFNGTVFVVPSVSQVALRPGIVIPMFFGFAFGPLVGFFSGAVGNMFGDALSGFSLSPQWSVGNGLVGFIAGLAFLFHIKKRSTDAALATSGVLILLATAVYLLNRTVPNMMFFDPEDNVFGDAQITFIAGLSLLIGFLLILGARFLFRHRIILAVALVWSMLGNLLGIGFAAISDIWINGFSFAVAIVGEFLPAAGPNLIFAAVLIPIMVAAWEADRRQSVQ